MKKINTNSLLRDWRYALIAIGLLFLVNFGINCVSASSDFSELKLEATANGNEVNELPSVFSEALTRTVGSLYGIVDLFNIVALVAVSSLLGFHIMKFAFPNTLANIGDSFNAGWGEMKPTERTRWKIGVWALIFFAIVGGRAKAEESNLTLPVSDEAKKMIVHYEVGGRSYYERYLKRPTVPAWRTTVSGVTVMFGVDVGHMNDSQIHTALHGIASASDIRALQSVSGLKGRRAHYEGLPKVRHLRFTWDQAMKVFERNTLPRFTKLTASAFALEKGRLHPHENGALTSLVFNRGSSLRGNRRREMRSIKYDIGRGYAGYVPMHIKSMKRLWSYSKLKGLHKRRDSEARLFRKGSLARIYAK